MLIERLAAALVLSACAIGCGGEEFSAEGSGGNDAGAGDAGTPPDGGPPAGKGLCATKTLAPWSRKGPEVGGTLAFNELMYHPAGDPQLEWIELYNPMAIDMDLSGWKLDGDVQYAFPSGTIVTGGALVVVAANAELLAQSTGFSGAIGSYTGQLPDDGGKVELWNNAGRLMDAIRYADVEPWPVIPDGSGASLAKRAPGTSSEVAEDWTASARVGGTPLAPNFDDPLAAPPVQTLVPEGATWRYDASGSDPGAAWASPGYDDSAWLSAPATFFATDTPGGPVAATATFTADNFFAIYVGKADGSGLTLVGRDAVGDWTSAETFQLQAAPDDYVYVAAWESPADDGGPQSLIGQFSLPDGTLLPTDPSTFEWVLGPPGASPGGALSDPAPPQALVQGVVEAANMASTWSTPLASADKASAPWGAALSGVFSAGTRFIWADTFDSVSASNVDKTFILFRSKAPLVSPGGATDIELVPTTTYFRTKFQVPDDVELVQPWLDALVDDGAVFYLNGTEVLRLRMPEGPLTSATLASETVGDATPSAGNLLAANTLLPGENLLAVEVHQAIPNDHDMTFGASLASSVTSKATGGPPPGLAFSEVAGTTGGAFWLELANLSTAAIDVGGYAIAKASGGEHVLAQRSLAPGALMTVDEAELGFGAKAADKLFLYSPDHSAAVDGVEVMGAPRGRSAGEAGWRYPDVATPGAPNVFVEHDEIVISEIMYSHPPVTAPDGSREKSPVEWIELFNRSSKPVDVSGFQLVDAVEYELPAGLSMPAGGYLVVAGDAGAMKAAYPDLSTIVGDFKGSLASSGENIVLRDACGNTADTVHYQDGGRWPAFADGGGSSLELRDPRADNTAAEAWAASDEAPASTWQTITYEGVAAPSSVGPDGVWQELVIGLLDAGVVLVDDVSVTADPAGAATPLITDGTFESGTPPSWRILGNHRHSEVIADPTDPGNHVLRLVATGPTEHMHNHAETTLAGGHVITNGVNYRISLRARWVTGSNQLSTRLYFNRLARTTELSVPALHGTPGAPNSTAEANLGPTYSGFHHAPVVPQPFEPVHVSVVAADPDGVEGLTLWYAVDGAPAASVPMTSQGGGRFVGMVPGGPASSVVQFYVTGKDALGALSSFPALGPASRALWKVDDGLAATNGLHNLRVILTPGDTDWLYDRKNLMSNDPVGATVIDDEREAFYDVGVRLKSSERGRPEVARVGFALRFQPDQPFRGIYCSMMVDRSEGVGFGQREMLIDQVLNHAGSVTSQYDDLVKVLTPRPEHTGPAQLQLARFGDLLLDAQFKDGGDGMLFEYELIYYPLTTDDGTPTGNKLPQPDSVVGTAIRDLGDDKEAYRLPFIVKNNRWRDDYRGFIAFTKVFGLQGAELDAQVDDVIDVDEWLRAFAFATLSGAVDNYGAGDAHNGDFYVRPSDERVLYFPHDLDFYGGSPQSPVVASGDLAKLIASPRRSRIYYGHLYDIISSSYNATYMGYWCDRLSTLLPAQDFAGHLQFITARADWVLSSAPDAVLKAIPKVPFAITTGGGAPVSVTTETVTLDGVGWVDVDEVRSAEQPLALTWLTQTAWQATIPLTCGVNAIELAAHDRHGQPVGSDTLSVTRSGADCP